ncbi:hypothetical protein H0H93_009952, partial [Arthromyces matolae]
MTEMMNVPFEERTDATETNLTRLAGRHLMIKSDYHGHINSFLKVIEDSALLITPSIKGINLILGDTPHWRKKNDRTASLEVWQDEVSAVVDHRDDIDPLEGWQWDQIFYIQFPASLRLSLHAPSRSTSWKSLRASLEPYCLRVGFLCYLWRIHLATDIAEEEDGGAKGAGNALTRKVNDVALNPLHAHISDVPIHRFGNVTNGPMVSKSSKWRPNVCTAFARRQVSRSRPSFKAPPKRKHGLTPTAFNDDVHALRCLAQLRSKDKSIEKYIYLAMLKEQDPSMFYKLCLQYMSEFTPVIYTPTCTVGDACLQFSHIYRRPEGLVDKGKIREVISNWPKIDEARISVVTD